MKKLSVIVLSVCMLAAMISGCGSASGVSADAAGAGTTAGKKEPTTLKMAISALEKSIQGLTGNYWAELCKKGREEQATTIDVVLYPNNQLGKVSEVLEQLAMGENVIVATDASALKAYAPDLGILDRPYFFSSEEEVPRLFQTEWFGQQCEELYNKGIKVVNATMIYGTRQIMAKKPLRDPADLKGVKLRVPGNDLSTGIIEAMGGVPTALSLSDVYASIQQGVVDGMENPIATHVDSSIWN